MRKKSQDFRRIYFFAKFRVETEKWGENMARKYKIITPEDRRTIEEVYSDGLAPVEIADKIGVSPSSIYRELARGYTGDTDENGRPAYSADVAQADVKQNMSRRGRPFAR